MQIYTATIERDAEQAAQMQAAARFFGISMPFFLNLCLRHGIEWAQRKADTAEMDDGPDDSPGDD